MVGSTVVALPLVTGDLTLYFDFEEIITTDLVGADATGRLLDQSGNDYGPADTHEIGEIHEGDDSDPTSGTFELGPGIRGMGGVFTQSERPDTNMPVYVTVDGAVLTANYSHLLPANTGAFTIAAWLNVNDTGGDQSVFQARSALSPGHGCPHIQLQGDGRLRMTWRNGRHLFVVSETVYLDGSTHNSLASYPTSEWFHYAGSYDTSTNEFAMYFNGLQFHTGQSSQPGAGQPLGDWGGHEGFGDFFAAGFGATYDAGDRRFDGLMDELYVFSRALSADEVSDLYDFDPGPSLNIKTELITGSPVSLIQMVDTPATALDLEFEYQFLTTTGQLDVLLDGTLLGTIDAPAALEVNPLTALFTVDEALLNLTDVELEFILRFNTPVRRCPLPRPGQWRL